MSNDLTVIQPNANLPAKTLALMSEWRESPRKSYDNLPDVISQTEIFASESPTLAQIKNGIDEQHSLMIISMAIEDVNAMFRRDRRMEERDIVLTAKAILRRYWYLKPEDIKKCFNGPRPKSFVLEGDSFLSWLAEYDLKRDNACEDSAVNGNNDSGSCGAVTHAAYLAMLEARANDGDKEAVQILKDYQKRTKTPTAEQQREKELAFFKFKQQYLKAKSNGNKTTSNAPDETHGGA